MSVATLALGAAEGMFGNATAPRGNSMSISSTLTGSAGLTVSGPGSVTLSGINTDTGTNSLDSGTLTCTATTPAPAPYTLTGGTLQASRPRADRRRHAATVPA